MLSAAALLGLSTISLSQAEDVVDPAAADSAEATEQAATAEDAASEDVEATDDAEATDEADDAAAEEETEEAEEEIPQDTPQVQKLIALYPKLVERIQPYGKVCFDGDENCDITLTASGGSVDGEPRDGKAVYDAICQTCHGSGLLNSPKLGDAGAWASRIGKGTETLYDHAINGFNAMPARGGADIPDEEVQNAVDYMIEQSS